MIDDEKADLWLVIFGLNPSMAARFRCSEKPGLADVTSAPKWDRDFEKEPKAKAIGLQQWKEAFALALQIDELVPGLPPPVPGADPLGFLWLTYRTKDEREFALELHADLTKSAYRWTAMVGGTRQRHETSSTNLRPMIESLRATFGETERQRAARKAVDVEAI